MARALLAQAVEAEVATLLSRYADETTDDGRKRLVRHGHLPEREIMTGIGPVGVRCPRVRDRVGEGSQRIRFSSAILPPYARRSKSLEVLIPILCTIPIIFANIADPVGSGFVASFPRPGGNATGFTTLEPTMVGKWLELLKQIAPRVNRAAL